MGGAQGVLNKKSTAKEVAEHFSGGVPDFLKGKTAIVTGGNSGIGLETVKVLAFYGARVVLASRTVENGLKAIEAEIKVPGHGGYVVADVSNIVVKQLELEDLASVKAFADDIIATEDRIDFLILNAGIMALPTLQYTKYGFEKQIGVNHFGHFYLTKLLTPKLEKQDFPSRVVVLSSTAHKMGSVNLDDLFYKHGRGYSSWGAYGQSKLANILFAKELADRLKNTKSTAVSLHPGVIATNLSRYSMTGPILRGIVMSIITDKTIPQGASTTIYGALAPELAEEKHRGVYLSDNSIVTPNREGQDLDGKKRVAFWELTEKILNEALTTGGGEAGAVAEAAAVPAPVPVPGGEAAVPVPVATGPTPVPVVGEEGAPAPVPVGGEEAKEAVAVPVAGGEEAVVPAPVAVAEETKPEPTA